MLKLVIIGNLGADAEIKNENGNRFLSFRVADTIMLKPKQEQITTWVSCSKNSNFDNLVPYLKKGYKGLLLWTLNYSYLCRSRRQ